MLNQNIYTQNSHNDNSDDDECYYSLDEEAPESAPKNKGSRAPLLLLLKLITSPVEGWKAIKRAEIHPQKFAWECFYPLVLIAALSQFTALFYEADSSLPVVITLAIIIFMTLLLGNFGTILCCGLFLPRHEKAKLDTPFGRIFVMAMVCTLAIAITLWNIIPPLGPLVIFIPVYTIYLIVKGIRFLRINPDAYTKVSVILSALVIGIPMILYTIFTELIPQ